MRLLWLCNLIPGAVTAARSGKPSSGGLWVDHVLSDLRETPVQLRILCRGPVTETGAVDEKCSYGIFQEPKPQRYEKALEDYFLQELRSFRPDVIHIWGTEYGHTLAMVNAAQQAGLLGATAISIQGLCSIHAQHYNQGIPLAVRHSYTLRDFLRMDNLFWQQKTFRKRGALEIAALEKARHVIGRTDWDFACTEQVNPRRVYHFCNETLRESFYQGSWTLGNCKKHRIFASSCAYPIKGFHFLLEAFHQVLKRYPDATLAVPGESFLLNQRTSYQKYLAKLAQQYQIADKIEFLGHLSAEEMKQAYLQANVFVLPSTIENSPNSLGEAMLLGLPCVAADVGGVADMMQHKKEGYCYQGTAPYMLAYYIEKVFSQPETAEEMGKNAAVRGKITHHAARNFRNLLETYENLGKGEME